MTMVKGISLAHDSVHSTRPIINTEHRGYRRVQQLRISVAGVSGHAKPDGADAHAVQPLLRAGVQFQKEEEKFC